MRKLVICGSTLAVLAACSTFGVPPADPGYVGPTNATADIRNASGQNVGTATLTQVGTGLRLAVQGVNLPSGARGIHIHQTGACAGPDFASAGPHWNPANRQHGKDNPAGMHHGDLPNLLIGTDGQGTMEYTISGARLAGPSGAVLDGDGAAVVIHADADDYRTDPSGNSGSRIACGVFR